MINRSLKISLRKSRGASQFQDIIHKGAAPIAVFFVLIWNLHKFGSFFRNMSAFCKLHGYIGIQVS